MRRFGAIGEYSQGDLLHPLSPTQGEAPSSGSQQRQRRDKGGHNPCPNRCPALHMTCKNSMSPALLLPRVVTLLASFLYVRDQRKTHVQPRHPDDNPFQCSNWASFPRLEGCLRGLVASAERRAWRPDGSMPPRTLRFKGRTFPLRSGVTLNQLFEAKIYEPWVELIAEQGAHVALVLPPRRACWAYAQLHRDLTTFLDENSDVAPGEMLLSVTTISEGLAREIIDPNELNKIEPFCSGFSDSTPTYHIVPFNPGPV